MVYSGRIIQNLHQGLAFNSFFQACEVNNWINHSQLFLDDIKPVIYLLSVTNTVKACFHAKGFLFFFIIVIKGLFIYLWTWDRNTYALRMEYFIPSQDWVDHIQDSFQLLPTNWKWPEDIFSKQFSSHCCFFSLSAEYYLKTSKPLPFQPFLFQFLCWATFLNQSIMLPLPNQSSIWVIKVNWRFMSYSSLLCLL